MQIQSIKQTGDKTMFTKTKVALSVALLLSLGGAVMAGDSGENHQDNTNSTGPNPYMDRSGPYMPSGGNNLGGGNEAFAKYLGQHHVVTPHAKK
jgi:hypothetical protein